MNSKTPISVEDHQASQESLTQEADQHVEEVPEDSIEEQEPREESETPMTTVPDVSNIFRFDFQSLQDLMQGFQEKIDGQGKKLKQMQAEMQAKDKKQGKDTARALANLERNIQKTSARLEAHRQKVKKFNEAVGKQMKDLKRA